jgi:hypothetical protein
LALKSFLIAPYSSGQQSDVEPFLLPEDAFTTLEDAYVWRGRVKKRWGYSLLGSDDLNSRFRINLGNTDGAGAGAGNVPGLVYKTGQMFSIGAEIFTVNSAGSPSVMLTTGSATTHTFDTATGAYVFAGAAAATAIYFYPAEPVMGLRTRENSLTNVDDVVGFDTQFSYRRVAGAWEVIGVAAADLWTGSNSQFVWTWNARGSKPYETNLYATNFKARNAANDGIKFLPVSSVTWTNMLPQLDSGVGTRFLTGCRIILPFKDRLIALNTLELETVTTRSYEQRCRFSQNGDPTADATSWLDDIPGRGGYVDAPTKEKIITAQLLKDRLIVYFESSTWELVYTKDVILPFVWQQLDAELGAESTFSIIGFDKTAVGVGNRGIHACDGANVQRIDQKIPDEVFKIHNANDGVERVYGIRDYRPELVYWTFPDYNDSPTFPNRVLVYNYLEQTWAFFHESFTCFGYYQRESGVTWNDLTALYGTWDNWNDAWNTGSEQSAFPLIVAGNQQGWTFKLDTDKSSNSQSLQITDVTLPSTLLVKDHNLMPGDYVRVEDAQGSTNLNLSILEVLSVTDANTIVVNGTFTGTYTGGGKLTRISQINILTKRFNPGTPIGQQFSCPYLDFLLVRTDAGELSVDYFLESYTNSSVQELPVDNPAILGSNVLFTKPETDVDGQPAQDVIWHRYFVGSEQQFLQLRFFLSDAQITDYAIATSGFELQAMLIYIEAGGRLVS